MKKLFYSDTFSFELTDQEAAEAIKCFSASPSAPYFCERTKNFLTFSGLKLIGTKDMHSDMEAYVALMDDPPAMQSVNYGTIKVPLLKKIYWASPADGSFYKEEENEKGVKGLKRIYIKDDCMKPLEKWVMVHYDVWLEKKLYLYSESSVWQEAKKYNVLKESFYFNISKNKNEGEKTTEKDASKTA